MKEILPSNLQSKTTQRISFGLQSSPANNPNESWVSPSALLFQNKFSLTFIHLAACGILFIQFFINMHCTVQNFNLFFDIKGFSLFIPFIKGNFDTIYPFLNDNLLKVPRQEKCLTKLNSCKYLFTIFFAIGKMTVVIDFECQVLQKYDFVSKIYTILNERAKKNSK